MTTVGIVLGIAVLGAALRRLARPTSEYMSDKWRREHAQGDDRDGWDHYLAHIGMTWPLQRDLEHPATEAALHSGSIVSGTPPPKPRTYSGW